MKTAKDVATAGLWICLAVAHTQWYVQVALGVVASIQLVLAWQQRSTKRGSEAHHVGGGLTSSTSIKEHG